MDKMQAMVMAFHEKFDRPVGTTPELSNRDFRIGLIRDEIHELELATLKGDLVESVDALADILYVTLGTAVEWGVDMQEIFEIVHGANMRKIGGEVRGDGKVLKPDGWIGPEADIANELIEQGAAVAIKHIAP